MAPSGPPPTTPTDGGPSPPSGPENPGGLALGPAIRRTLLIALAVVLGLVLLGVATSLPWASTAGLQTPNLLLVLAAMAVWALSPILQAWRFRYLLALRSSRPPFGFLVELHFAERFFTPILPFRLSLPVKALLLQRGGGVEMGTGLSITVLDALFEAGTVVAIAVMGAPLLVRTPLYLFGLVALGLAAAFFLVTPERLKARGERLREGTFLRRAVAFLYDLRLQTSALLRDYRLLGIVPFLLAFQIPVLATGALLLLSVGYTVPLIPLLVILNASTLLGNATAIPSGWGARELTLTALLGIAGVPTGSALLVSIMSRAATIPPMAIGYGFAVRIGWKGLLSKP